MKSVEIKLNTEEYGHLTEYANFFRVSVNEMALAMYQAGFNKITDEVMKLSEEKKEELN